MKRTAFERISEMTSLFFRGVMNVCVIAFFACCAFVASSDLMAKTFQIDLTSAAAREPEAGTLLSADPLPEGVVRRFNLAAGVADVGIISCGDELQFSLFDDVTLTLTLKEKTPSPLGGDVFLAEIDGCEGTLSAVVLRTEDGLTIDVQDFLNEKIYKVISTSSGVTVSEYEPADEGVCGCDTLVPPEINETAEVLTSSAAVIDPAWDVCVDILVAYDKNAAAYAQANGGMTTFAQLAVQRMNTALANTGLNQSFRFRLVGVTSVSVSADDVGTALRAVTDGKSGWAKIQTVRDDVGADIVTTLIDTGSASGTVGMGWALEYLSQLSYFASHAYNACAIRSVERSDTMTHECGHNMGAGHSSEQTSSPGPQLYDYSAGYYLTAGGKAYCTIMAYGHENPSGVRATDIPYFSSPDHFYNGVCVGDATHDNTQTLEQTFSHAAKWREQKIPVSYDIAFSPASGTLFSGSLTVTLTPDRDGDVRYTLDGREPSATSRLYSGPFAISKTTTVKAVSVINDVCATLCTATYYSKTDIGYAVGLPDLEWKLSVPATSTCGLQLSKTVDGAAVGAKVANGDTCKFSTVINGPATITWKDIASGGVKFNVLSNGVSLISEIWDGASSSWQEKSVDIPAGEQKVEFCLGSNKSGTEYYLDAFQIYYTPRPVFVPSTSTSADDAYTFKKEMLVTLSAPDDALSIYYTLDGSNPNKNGAILYDGPFFINATTRVKAIAKRADGDVSAVAEGLFVENSPASAGEWTVDGSAAYSALESNGRMIAELCWLYPDCTWSSTLKPYITDEAFTAWAKMNGVYLLANLWEGRGTATNSNFSLLYFQSALYAQLSGSIYYPTFVFASAEDPDYCLGAMVARNDAQYKVNGVYFENSVESLIACFASFLGNATPLAAPTVSASTANDRTFPFSVTLANPNGTGTLYYTLDGSMPTRENGVRYTGAITIPSKGTVLTAVVWPTDTDAVSGVPLRVTYRSLDEDIGIDGVSWTNDPNYPWTITKTDSGTTFSGAKDSSINSIDSTLTAVVQGPGRVTFDYTIVSKTNGTLTFLVNGTSVATWTTPAKNSSYSYNVESSGKTEIAWRYRSYASDSETTYKGEIANFEWLSYSAPDPVEGVTASEGEYGDGTVVRWAENSRADSYVVYRNAVNDPSGAVQIGTTEKLRYWDYACEYGQKYYYWVKAVNTYGESVFSSVVEGWRAAAYTITLIDDTGRFDTLQKEVARGESLTLSVEVTVSGWRIGGWATGPNGPIVYADRTVLTPESDMTLYAVWVTDVLWTIDENNVLTKGVLNGVTDVYIPNGVVKIGNSVFSFDTSITRITIPAGVTEIGSYFCYKASSLKSVVFEGNAPAMKSTTFGSLSSDCTVYVKEGSTGWGVDIPGTWRGLTIKYSNEAIPELSNSATPAEVAAALSGSADAKLTANITDAATYAGYRAWAKTVKTSDGATLAGLATVKRAPCAWLSYALNSGTLVPAEPKAGDVVIDTFTDGGLSGTFDFTVSLKDILVGEGAREANLRKVFTIAGGETLGEETLSPDAVEVNAAAAEAGKVKFTVKPKEEPKFGRFFFRVKMN